jgi:hypothetical protein
MKNRSSLQSQHPPATHHAPAPHRLSDLSQAAPAHGTSHVPASERDRKLKRHNEHPD